MNICKIRCILGTLPLSLVVLLCSCAANPPASIENGPAAEAVSNISGDNETATKAAPLESKVLAADIAGIPPGPSELATRLAASSDNMSSYNGKEVIVEGIVVELGSFIDPSLGNALVLYFNNPGQHVASYEAWSKGMTGTDFRVIIRENDVPGFCYRSMFVGRRMAVAGKMDVYHGAPVIFVSDPSQVTFVGATPATEPALSIVITCTTEIADNITYYRYQGTITNNNAEWAVHDLYLGENKLADCIPPKGCPNIAAQYLEKQILTKAVACPNYIKFDTKFSADAAGGAGMDPLTRQIAIPALNYKWKGLPKQ
jgi:hypothetical protein